MAQGRKGKVAWNPGVTPTSARPHPIMREKGDVPPDVGERLLVGTLWSTKIDLVEFKSAAIQSHEIPYLTSTAKGWGRASKSFPMGTMAVYIGPTRVEEAGRDRMVNIMRHVFLFGTQRYMVLDLGDLSPIDPE